MGDEAEEKQSSEKPAMDAPQEEFIQQKAVPSEPKTFAPGDDRKRDKPKSD